MGIKDEEKTLPIKPTLFDKSKLSTKEFANYLYEIEFKKSAKKVRDMSLAGYVHAIHPYLRDVQSEVIHYGFVGDRKIMSAVVRSTITVSYKTSAMSGGSLNEMKFTALADGDTTNVPSSDTLVRTVETRALKRAIARALDISKVDLNDEFVDEEEVGTPISREHNNVEDNTPKKSSKKSPQDIAAEKAKKQKELEDDAEKEAQDDADENEARKDEDW
jgi:hypothetical protein